jgi:hypothetical protein
LPKRPARTLSDTLTVSAIISKGAGMATSYRSTRTIFEPCSPMPAISPFWSKINP